jgi:K(+)-stimulated pyrophosphate-energized sodium pump
MNLVSVLIAPAIVMLTVGPNANPALRYGIAAVAVAVAVTAIAISKRRDLAIGGGDEPEAVVQTPRPDREESAAAQVNSAAMAEKDAATRR